MREDSRRIDRRGFLKGAVAMGLGAALGGTVFGCSSAPAAAPTTQAGSPSGIKPIKLKFHSYTTPPPSASGMASQYFMDEVTKRSGGAVTWEVYWSGALADTTGQLDLVAKGAVDISKTSLPYFPAKFPIGHFEYAFPFPPDDPVLVTKAKRQIYEEFPAKRAEFDRNGVVMLANTVCAYYELQSKAPINSLADMKGRKVGMVGRYFGKWFEPVGAVPVVKGAPDRYTDLQSGVVDVSLLWLDLAYSLKLHEQAKYLIQLGLGSFLAEDVLFNAEKFKTLAPELQKILLDAGKDSEMWAAEYQKNNRDQIIPKMKEAGVTVIQFPQADRERWASMVPDIPAEWAAEVAAGGVAGWEIAKRWQEITTSLGYKWPREWAVKK